MAKADLSTFGLDRPESGDDVVVPFTLEGLDCRGRAVRLGNAFDIIVARHGYPEQVARLLGEALVLTALVGSSLKFDGRFILQTQTDGSVPMIVVDLDAPNRLRAYARFDENRLAELGGDRPYEAGTLLGNGHLAMTVDQGRYTDRYQGIVALDGIGFEQAARHYFQQSEQIPTEIRLAVAEHVERGVSGRHWRAAGVMVQFLPEGGGKLMPDLPGDGDFENEDMRDPHFEQADHWTEAKALLSTLSDGELVDPELSPERLLFRLYHETGVRVFEPLALEENCACSAERIADMLANSFTKDQRQDMAVNGEIEVVCEFCSAAYHFKPEEFDSEG